MAGGQVITVSLNSPEEMFVLAPADLFSEYRNFMTGLEYCISVLRSRRSSGPVRIELALPDEVISAGIERRIGQTLNRYCDHRIAYNKQEQRAVRLDGVYSLCIGIPIVVVGFLLVIIKGSIVGSTGNANLILDSGGWVLEWVGLGSPSTRSCSRHWRMEERTGCSSAFELQTSPSSRIRLRGSEVGADLTVQNSAAQLGHCAVVRHLHRRARGHRRSRPRWRTNSWNSSGVMSPLASAA